MSEKEPEIQALNLGDSGYMLLRKDESQSAVQLLFRTREQQYKFNHPYQCGTNYQLPYQAAEFSHRVQNNDYLVIGTDGLYDNLTNEMILDCFVPKESDVQEICNCIGQKSFKYSQDKNWDSPFARNAKAVGKYYKGGKQDDITVIVSQVVLKDNSE